MSDHEIRLRYSDDGSHTLSEWQAEDIGEVGQYGKRIVFTRLGSFYTRTLTISCSSPRRRDMLGAVAAIQGTVG